MIVLVRVDHQLNETSEDEKDYHYGIVSNIKNQISSTHIFRSQELRRQLSDLLLIVIPRKEKMTGIKLISSLKYPIIFST